jgi:hypothetical protein
MEIINFHAAWIGIVLGFIAGAVIGLFFHDDQWAGGYSSWPRRMMRLGHISFFGIAFINFAYSFSIHVFNIHAAITYPSYLFIIGAITMPLICFLSAYKKGFRHLFPIPVISLLIGAVIFIVKGGIL